MERTVLEETIVLTVRLIVNVSVENSAGEDDEDPLGEGKGNE